MRAAIRVVPILVVLVFTAAGCLHSWGPQSGPVLGRVTDALEPAVVGVDSWRAVSSGAFHGCGIRERGDLFCWGDGSLGAVGQASLGSYPTPVPVGEATDWTAVAAAGMHTCGIRAGGELHCWGFQWISELGLDSDEAVVPTPTRVGTWSDWTAVAGGQDHTCGIRAGGLLYCWGWNAFGRAGQPGLWDEYRIPTLVDAGDGWTSLSASNDYACGIQDGMVRCWGWDPSFDSLGALPPSPDVPRTMSDLDGWTEVAAASGYLCGIRGGEASCMGANDFGQLGDGTQTSRTTLAPVTTVDVGWADLSAGERAVCGITATHQLWCWGSNDGGRLGDGTSVDRLVPTRIGTASDWIDADLGAAGSYGVRGQTG